MFTYSSFYPYVYRTCPSLRNRSARCPRRPSHVPSVRNGLRKGPVRVAQTSLITSCKNGAGRTLGIARANTVGVGVNPPPPCPNCMILLSYNNIPSSQSLFRALLSRKPILDYSLFGWSLEVSRISRSPVVIFQVRLMLHPGAADATVL